MLKLSILQNTCLVRKCNGCGAITAVSTVNDVAAYKRLRTPGTTISAVTKSKAAEAFSALSSCKCGDTTTELEEEYALFLERESERLEAEMADAEDFLHGDVD